MKLYKLRNCRNIVRFRFPSYNGRETSIEWQQRTKTQVAKTIIFKCINVFDRRKLPNMRKKRKTRKEKDKTAENEKDKTAGRRRSTGATNRRTKCFPRSRKPSSCQFNSCTSCPTKPIDYPSSYSMSQLIVSLAVARIKTTAGSVNDCREWTN